MASQWHRILAVALVFAAMNGVAYPKEITFLSSGDRPISHLSFSNQGDRLACVSVTSEVSVWDLREKRRLARFDASAKAATDRAFADVADIDGEGGLGRIQIAIVGLGLDAVTAAAGFVVDA